ncbi:MAG: hypothetical protein AAGA91_06535, partial [Pseudomonadota bacterium]
MNAILHIGTEKTGTSSIQRYLEQNRDALRESGYYYPVSIGFEHHQALAAVCVDIERPDDFYDDDIVGNFEERMRKNKAIVDGFGSELRELDGHIHTVVISSEHFHSRITSECEINRLASLLRSHFEQITVICYLREQVAACTSLYSTALK